MMLTEEKLKKLVSLMVEKKILLLKEGVKFQAIRSLTIEAQQAAMKFEENMVDALDLLNPDEMDDDHQQIYSQTMADMHSKVIEAVVHAANVLKNLPNAKKEENHGKKDKKPSTEPMPVIDAVKSEI
jgi:hypothetical protein